MGKCFDAELNRFVYCTSQLSTYVAVAVIIPVVALLLLALVYLYIRFQQRRARRNAEEFAPTSLSTIISVYNVESAAEREKPPPSYEESTEI